MISLSEARYLLSVWSGRELGEIRRDCYYPAVSPMFRDYTSGYRKSSGVDNIEELVEKVAVTVRLCRPVNGKIIKRTFIEGVETKRATLNVALADFRKCWESLP